MMQQNINRLINDIILYLLFFTQTLYGVNIYFYLITVQKNGRYMMTSLSVS